MGVPLHVLIVEDSEIDFLCLVQELRRGGYDPVCERVETDEAMSAALDREPWDVILINYTLPRFSGIAALDLIKRKHIDLPAIIVSGTIDEETAVTAMKAGARDYMMKKNLSRLIPAIEREMGETKRRQENRRIEKALQETEKKFFTVFQHSPVPMAIASVEEGRLFDVNEQYTRLMGFSPTELIGHTTAELNLWADPDERKRYIRSIKKNHGKIQSCPVSVRTKSGNVIKILFSADIIKINNTPCLLSSAVDITERVKAEEILKIQSHILDRMAEGVSLSDEEGFITFTNPAYDAMFGYERGELIGKHVSLLNVGCSADNIRLSSEIRQELQSKGVWSGELANRKKDGTPLTTHAYISALETSEKQFRVTVQENITERKRVEEDLRRSEENFRRSLDDSPLGVRIVTAEGETIYANRAILEIYGYDSIEGFKTNPLKKRYTPESYAEFQIRRGKRERGDYGPSEYEVSIVRKDGEVRQLQVFRKIVLWEGEKQFQTIYQDITDRRRAESEIQSLARFPSESLNQVLRIARDGTLLYINAAGLSQLPEWHLKVGQGVPSMMRDVVSDVLNSGKPRLLDSEHGGRIYSFFITPIADADYANIYGHDITKSKRAEEELRASREQLRALAGRLQAVREEERTQIAREIHDELGGALTGLKIDFSLLIKTVLKIENETVRRSVLAGMDSMIESIDATIRTVRRIAMELRPGVLDDLGLVAALEWQLIDFEKRTDIRCEFFPPAEDTSPNADLSTALFRIVQEALTNVARHSGATEVRVRLHAADDFCTLDVEDNGKGIEKKKVLSLKSLGLLGMRERAQMFGGRVIVTGTPGRGTKVTVEIPAVEKRKMDRDQGEAAG